MPPADRTARVEKLFIEDPAAAPRSFFSENLDRFETETARGLDLMTDLMPDARFLNDDETLTHLHGCISLKRADVP